MRYLPINKNQIPVSMFVTVEGQQYTFQFSYNASFDFFTVTLSKDGAPLVTGEKIVLERPLFATINNPFTQTYFIPMDLARLESNITYDNFGDTVFIWQFTMIDGVIVDE